MIKLFLDTRVLGLGMHSSVISFNKMSHTFPINNSVIVFQLFVYLKRMF